jgi:hypothetical protein
MTLRTPHDEALHQLAVEEYDAWLEYLEACRSAGDKYDAVEARAWSRIGPRLRAVAARRRSLKRRVAA